MFLHELLLSFFCDNVSAVYTRSNINVLNMSNRLREKVRMGDILLTTNTQTSSQRAFRNNYLIDSRSVCAIVIKDARRTQGDLLAPGLYLGLGAPGRSLS
ncbi:hypothetical protein Hanom_Chr05g00385851 [Helianthus anomalus]